MIAPPAAPATPPITAPLAALLQPSFFSAVCDVPLLAVPLPAVLPVFVCSPELDEEEEEEELVCDTGFDCDVFAGIYLTMVLVFSGAAFSAVVADKHSQPLIHFEPSMR